MAAATKKIEANLETAFYRGDYHTVLESSVDHNPPRICPQLFPFIIGSLTYSGRLEEATLHFDRMKETLPIESLFAGRLYLGTAYCRQSAYDRAIGYFIANLRDSRKNPDPRLLTYTYQGIGFYRFFAGRYANAAAAARRALTSALESNFLWGKYLASDLIGHALIETGQISAGMKSLQDSQKFSKQLGNGEMDDAIRISLAIYSAKYGLSPSSDLETLQKFYESLAPQDTYSQAALLLEMGRQLTLRGKLTASQEALNKACRLIYSSGHRRQGVMLNLRYAYNMMLGGEPHQALNLLQTAGKNFNPRVDKALEVQVLGLECRLKAMLGLATDNDPLKKRLATLVQYTGTGIGRRIRDRNHGAEQSFITPGEDPLGDLTDLAKTGKQEHLETILSSGYLSLLYSLLKINPGESVLYLDLVPGSLLVAQRGNLDYQAQGVTTSIRALLRKLSQGECTKEELIESVWGYAYDPIRHDSLIYPAISRLRQLLGDRAHWIEVTTNGYRLSPGVKAKFVEWERDSIPVEIDETSSLPTSVLDKLNHRQLQILRTLKREEFLDVQAYKRKFQVSQITATRDLTTLHELALVKRVGKGRATKYLVCA